eukprot:scaffold435_cov46-Phaeocystis_antarctica.AAC.3
MARVRAMVRGRARYLQVEGGDLRRPLGLSEAAAQQRRAPRRRRVAARVPGRVRMRAWARVSKVRVKVRVRAAARVPDEAPHLVDERGGGLP